MTNKAGHKTFRKVLVANRGEIAVRIMRTLRDMGIPSVAVYSDVDRSALHVRMADEAWHIGRSPSTESYLNITKLMQTCIAARADAVHPGYGFLSENADFARQCEAMGIAFIGPPSRAIELMGNKLAARQQAQEAGVPVVPGAHVDAASHLKDVARTIGYPVMLKGAAGGGGKGMRIVRTEDDLEAAFDRAQSESERAFGDRTVYVEKLLENIRHVEVQILGDRHGNLIHLGERDCSLQRRNQKLVEETPSPALIAHPELRPKMTEAALKLARAIDYSSAGTLEFLLAPEGDFYFLEMNTRVQVEHAITELTCGADLVREQIRIAQGQTLQWRQDDYAPSGHAIECRIYAEDPAEGFLPSPGTLSLLRLPSGPGVRVDAGVYEGGEVSSYYDPILAKLCAWAPDRPQAIARMRRALGECVIGGVRNNLSFHEDVMASALFASGDYTTSTVEAGAIAAQPGATEAEEMAAIGVALAQTLERAHHRPEGHTDSRQDLSAWQLNRLAP